MITLRKRMTWLAALAILAAACVGPFATTGPATEPGGAPPTEAAPSGPVVFRIGGSSAPDTINPAYAFYASSYYIFGLTYSSLVKEDLNGEYYGDLAKSWTHSDDNLTWAFTLKDGLQWHTGEPLTAEDVVWSINQIHADPEGWATLVNYTNGFKEVTAPDDQTVQITLEYPISNMEYRVSFLYALYRPDFEPLTTLEDLQNFTNEKLVGSGAFKLNTYDKDQGIIILDANPDFYDGRPVIDQVIFQFFDNSDAMVQALKVGDIDAIDLVPNSAFESVKGFDGVTGVNVHGRSFDELIINSANRDRDPAPTGNPALLDPQVRLAIGHAINKQDLVDIVYQGWAEPAWSIVSPTLGGGFWHNPNITDNSFDLDKANQILDDAGYVAGTDGVREKDGNRLEMRLQFDADSAEYARDADLISGWLDQIGIKATPEAVDSDTLIAATTGIGDYDLIVWGWGGDPDPDFILSIMLCDQFEVGGWSDSGYCSAEYDQLYLDQQQAASPEERQPIVYKMQDMLLRDLPYIVLYNYDDLYAYRSDRFSGFQFDAPNASLAGTRVLQKVTPVQ